MVVSSAEYGAMVVSCAEYGAMVVSSAAYGATVFSAGAAAITPAMAALLAEIVVRIFMPLAPPPAALIAWAASAGGIVAGFWYVASLANSAGLAWITASSGANFCAFASCVAFACAVATTDGGIDCAAARTVGGIDCAVATTDAGTFWAAATTVGWLCAKASSCAYLVDSVATCAP